ncbi:MAG: hypothetical protein ACP5QO_15210 [Clostridia bacterium]
MWDAALERWWLVECEVSDAFVDGHAGGGSFHLLDARRDRLLTGPEAWMKARAGRLDPERCVVAPDFEERYTRGWSSLRVHGGHDLAGLTRREMLRRTRGLMDDTNPLARAAPLDESPATRRSGLPSRDQRALAPAGRLAIPDTVTSRSPASRAPNRLGEPALSDGLIDARHHDDITTATPAPLERPGSRR